MSEERFGYKGRITAPRLANIGAKLKYAAMRTNLDVDEFYEDKGFFTTTVVYKVSSTNEDDVKDFTRWFNSL